MNARYNVAIVGQTGVGKSTFINYLYGAYVAKADIGKPVTKNGFHPVELEINGLPVTLFDSWGLEVGKHDQWMSELSKELDKRGINQSASEWFHSVFYCIQAGGNRIQDCDIDIIKRFIENKYNVSVILTKCDQVGEDDENAMKQTIQASIPGISVISVCSEEKKTRSGDTKPFGKVDVERKAFSDFFDSLIIRLPLRCNYVMKEIKKSWLRDVKSYVDDISMGGFNDDAIRSRIKERSENLRNTLLSEVNNEIDSVIKMYGDFSKKLSYPPNDKNSADMEAMNFIQTSSEWVWYEIPAFIILSPIVIVWGLFTGKSNCKSDLLIEISTAQSKVDNYIEEQTRKIKEMLQESKAKVL